MQRADVGKFDPSGAGDPAGSIFGLPFTEAESNVVLLPVPWEATVSYGRGTALGPAAIRAASPQLDLFDPGLAALGLGQPWQWGIHMRAEDPWVRALDQRARARAEAVIEAGGIVGDDPDLRAALDEVNACSVQLDAWVRQQVDALLDQGKRVGVVGGDHSVALGCIEAHAARWPGLGVLHVDAHADLRAAYEGFERSHASVMHNALRRADLGALVQVGIRDLSAAEHALAHADPRVTTHLEVAMRARTLGGVPFGVVCRRIVDALPQRVYISFDIDGLDPALCPSTGTPVPGGLSFVEAEALLLAVVRSGRTVVGFDLVEVAPSGRPGDEWDANVGARVLHRLCGLALLGRGARD
ncbi:MAG: agmatinase family protein [Myxococcales bacterium]|nr:agmatinase family protein [Myxococcales bacterium]